MYNLLTTLDITWLQVLLNTDEYNCMICVCSRNRCHSTEFTYASSRYYLLLSFMHGWKMTSKKKI